MSVNLLPQSAPQPEAPRPATRADEATPDAPSFAQALSTVSGAKTSAAVRVESSATGTQRATREEDRADPVVDPQTVQSLPLSWPPASGTAAQNALQCATREDPASTAGARTRVQETGDPGGLVAASLALLNGRTAARASGAAGTASPIDAAVGAAIDTAGTALADSLQPAEIAASNAQTLTAKAKAAPLSATAADGHGPRFGHSLVPPTAAEPPDSLSISTDAAPATALLLLPAHPRGLLPQEARPSAALDFTSGVASIAAAAIPAAPTPSPVQLSIDTPALTPGWREEIAQRLTQLVVLRHNHAEIRLNPADLGPISVRIDMDAGQANLLIQAPQPATRDSLELALPQLRNALAQQGITLGQTSVQDERGAPSRDPGAQTSARQDRGQIAVTADRLDGSLRVRRGLVDLFA